jgi:DNA-binding MarR family transcriptional regulator
VLAAVGERPGATAAELSVASGVSRPTIYAVLKSLTERGEIRRRDLPAGQVGYAPGEAPEPAGSERRAAQGG